MRVERNTVELACRWQVRRLETHEALTPDRARRWAETGDEGWLDIPQMPMQVHDVLASAGRMPKPGEMGSAQAGADVASSDWLYRLRLDELPPGDRLDLVCDGLDTVADVWWDGRFVAGHRSCYAPLRVELARPGPGRSPALLLHFHAPEAYARRELAGRLTDADRAAGVEPLGLLRKPRQDFGTFLGPRLTPIGPYAPIRLVGWSGASLDELSAVADVDDRYDRATVRAELVGRCASDRRPPAATVELLDPAGLSVGTTTPSVECTSTGWRAQAELTVEHPQRWHPRGQGDQPLYRLAATVAGDVDSADRVWRRLQVGLRSLACDGPFEIHINGRPVRLWGVNLPPIKPGHMWDRAYAERLLDLVEHARCNTIRLWGPGQPFDNEHLLAEADRRGLLVWFEFPHEFHPHPESDDHIAACLAEAEHFVRTHRHRASLLLWCGGNEGYLTLDEPAQADQARRARTGRALFDVAYRDLCARLDPARPYHPQSPSGGEFANSPLAGDTHCYDDLCVVPGIGRPVMATEHFRYTVPRPWSLRRWLGHDAWPVGFVSRLRDNHSGGLIPDAWRRLCTDGTLGTYMFGPLGEFYDTGDSLEGLVDRLDAASMAYVRRSVERLRRGRSRHDPTGLRRTRGHLWWKLVDTWPKLRNALIDADGEPGGAYYALRRAYAPLLLSFEIDLDDRLWLWAVNDTTEVVEGTAIVERLDELGRSVLQTFRAPVRLEPDESRPVADLSIWGSFFRNSVLTARLIDADGREEATISDTVAPEICCTLAEPGLRARREGDRVWLSCEAIARRVTLQGPASGGPQRGWVFEDNYFDLLPGRARSIDILRAPSRGEPSVRWAGRYRPTPVLPEGSR